MSASPFTDIASRDARLKRLFAAVRLNQRATAVMQGALPPGLAGLFRVVRIEQGEVLVYACNAGAATKLRLLADHLVHALRQRGLDILVPDADARADVHRIIFDELCQGEVRNVSRETYQRIIQQLAADGAQAVILGCTEICLLLGPNDACLPLYDTAALHVDAGLNWALQS